MAATFSDQPAGRGLSWFQSAWCHPACEWQAFYGTRVPDLHLLRYGRYLDATATHRLRGPEDIGRYAALINTADPMDFGTHRFLSESQRRVRYRFADEVLDAIGVYLLSLEPRRNPNPPPMDLVARGQAIFRREKCPPLPTTAVRSCETIETVRRS